MASTLHIPAQFIYHLLQKYRVRLVSFGLHLNCKGTLYFSCYKVIKYESN